MRLSTSEKDDALRAVVLSCFYYLALISFYINIGEDMTPDNYVLYLVPTVFCLSIYQRSTRLWLLSRQTLVHLFVGLLWCITFPLLYAWSYQKAWFISLIRIDFLFGTGLFLFLATLNILIAPTKHKRIAASFLAVLDLLGIFIPLVQWGYYFIYWHCLTPASVLALWQTNAEESSEFLAGMVGLVPFMLALLGLVLFFVVSYRSARSLLVRVECMPWSWQCRNVLVSFFLFLLLYVPFTLFPQTSIIDAWRDAGDYVYQISRYREHYDERFASLHLDDIHDTLAQKAPGTVIVVIGESASRDFMKAYTPSFPFDDTPWLSSELHNSNFDVFQNVYSSWSQTSPVLERALTEASQYNDKEFFDSTSIIDVAKKAGYETWWLTNQGLYGKYDSAIALVAHTADHAEWLDDSYFFTEKYDEALLNLLPQIDPTKNNFVVLHLMGSHIYYNSRYPHAFNRWENPKGGAGTNVESYANSILYTDDNLRRIYEYAKEHLHLQAMLYFSDHGEDLSISHNPDVFTFHMVRIPMFVYLSPAYQRALPERAEALKAHKDAYFTNDMMYDTVSGLLNAPSNRYDAGQDFASFHYRFGREDLTTMLGEHSLMEDNTTP